MVAADLIRPASYSVFARAVHWLTLLLIIALFALGWSADSFDKPTGRMLIDIHKAIGVTVLALTVIRLAYRLMAGAPSLPPDLPALQALGARIVQALLYVTLLVQPLSGMLGSMYFGHGVDFGLFEIPSFVGRDKDIGSMMFDIHNIDLWVLFGLICLHAVGGLYHHFIRRDAVLKSMLGTA